MKKVFQTKLKSITKVLTLVIIASLATFTGCKSYDEDINSLNTDVTALKSQLASLDTYTRAQIDAKITTLNGEITTLKTSLATLTANGATDAELAALKTDIESRFVTKAALDAYKTQVTTDIAAAVAGLATKASVDAVNVEVVKVQTALSALGVSVDAKILALKTELNAKDAELATAIGAVTARVATLEGLVAANTTGVAANKAAIVALQAELTALKAGTYTKAEIDTKLAAIDADLKKLGTDLRLEFEVLATRQLSGLLFVPEWVNNGFNAVEVGYIEGVLNSVTTKALFTEKDVIFRFNPTTADISGTQFAFINNSAVFNAPALSTAQGDASNLFAKPANPGNVGGSGTFKLKVNQWMDAPAGKTHNYFALQANKIVDGKTTSVVSDYVKVVPVKYNAYISNSTPATVPFIDYPDVKPLISNMSGVYNINYDGGANAPSIDLKSLVLATANKTVETALQRKTFLDLGFGTVDNEYEFKFDIDDAYLGVDGVTNQNSSLFVTLSGSTLKVTQGFASLDRTPLVRVRLYTKVVAPKVAQLLATAYMKFNITGERTVTYDVPAVTYSYEKLFKHSTPVAGGIDATLDKTAISIPWDVVNSEIYNKMAISHNDFRIIFPDALLQGATSKVVKFWNPDGILTTLTAAQVADVATELVSTLGAIDVDTRKITYNITPKAKFGKYEITYTFKPAANDKTLKLVYTFTVTAPNVDRAILPQYYYLGVDNKKAFTEGVAEGGVYTMKAYIGEFFGFGSSAYRNLFSPSNGTAINWIDGVSHKAEILTTGVSAGASTTGAVLTNTVNTLDGVYGTTTLPKSGADIRLTTPLTTEFRFYNVKVTEYNLPNGESLSNVFDVYFVNPISLEAKANPIVMINKTNGSAYTTDLKLNYVVKFKGRNIVTYGVNEPLVPTPTYLYYPASEYGVDASQLTYSVAPVAPYSPTILSLTGTTLKWDNAGGGISTNPLSAGTTSVKIATSFAERSLTVPVQVVPE